MGTPIAVVDVKTTGLFPHRGGRIVELAAVVMHVDGSIQREYSSLVFPGRVSGTKSFHGVSAADIAIAPSFKHVAAGLVDALHGCVALAAHNVGFVKGFLASELDGLGLALPPAFPLCTLQMARGGRIVDCCEEHDVPLGPSRTALDDARATAQLLARLLERDPALVATIEKLKPIQWPAVRWPRKAFIRVQAPTSNEPESFLGTLLSRVHRYRTAALSDPNTLPYEDLLDRALEDRLMGEIDATVLRETATCLGLSPGMAVAVHGRYLSRLTATAIARGKVTGAEHDDLRKVARMLGMLPELEWAMERMRREVPPGREMSPATFGRLQMT